MKSEAFKEFPTAFAKFQGMASSPPKKKHAVIAMKSGGTYEFDYADLADILDHVRKPMAECGLSWTSFLTPDGRSLETTIWHISGEWISTLYPLGHAADAKGFAGEITYGRRYSVTMLLGIAADEDTDGLPPQNAKDYKTTPKGNSNATTSRGPRPNPGQSALPQGSAASSGNPAPQSPNAPVGQPAAAGAGGSAGSTGPALAGPGERAHIARLAGERQWTTDSVQSYMVAAFSGKRLAAELTLPEYQALVAVIGAFSPIQAMEDLKQTPMFDQAKGLAIR